ncbi:MAG TPA: hypothetical protein VIQ51_14845 [Chryseosolibacter sp.]
MNRFEQDHKPLELHPLSTAQLSIESLGVAFGPGFRYSPADAHSTSGSDMPLNP